MRLYLIGYMGCGKSTIGRKIARYAHLRFVDTDSLVEQREQATVADVITYHGEEYFRGVEHSVLQSTAEEDDLVVSTGGGLPVWGDNMARIGSWVSRYTFVAVRRTSFHDYRHTVVRNARNLGV